MNVHPERHEMGGVGNTAPRGEAGGNMGQHHSTTAPQHTTHTHTHTQHLLTCCGMQSTRHRTGHAQHPMLARTHNTCTTHKHATANKPTNKHAHLGVLQVCHLSPGACDIPDAARHTIVRTTPPTLVVRQVLVLRHTHVQRRRARNAIGPSHGWRNRSSHTGHACVVA